ncbi:uncharacterized protein M421DRAFT_289455 [Didymella exigua CBS 183.55]|uniref:Uncharacterized protein n=1 Tax=Didymella exigua CBS 183.55 TaxID=1150837 RepID=A0A6A5RY99_9PLEO|nr:uncharacterized protein M421DRAFT_289455 [Didymella exigua CBS 183.55]KAF1932330.1 hypothetical protein M421DRAFT_289455 [Didymella exigua CBS 183.55]
MQVSDRYSPYASVTGWNAAVPEGINTNTYNSPFLCPANNTWFPDDKRGSSSRQTIRQSNVQHRPCNTNPTMGTVLGCRRGCLCNHEAGVTQDIVDLGIPPRDTEAWNSEPFTAVRHILHGRFVVVWRFDSACAVPSELTFLLVDSTMPPHPTQSQFNFLLGLSNVV